MRVKQRLINQIRKWVGYGELMSDYANLLASKDELFHTLMRLRVEHKKVVEENAKLNKDFMEALIRLNNMAPSAVQSELQELKRRLGITK